MSVPGLRAVRWTTESLHEGIKDYFAVGRTELGQSEWWGNGKVWRSGPGSIQVKQPGDVHRDLARHGPTTFMVVTLPSQELARATEHAKLRAVPQLERDDARALPFHRLLDAVSGNADRLSLEVALTEAINAFSTLSSESVDPARPVRRALSYLHEHIGESITLDDLAAHAELDKFHLCRAFRAQIGMPPHAYLTHLRISRAKALLRHGTRASEVAGLVGFYDQAALTRHFRRIVGTTPARFGKSRTSIAL